MAQYTDKDALVAEIERRRNICKKVILDLRSHENKDYYQGKAEAYKDILDTLDTLEAKEVDLEVELANYNREYVDENGFFNTEHLAKHFFELGLQAAQKGE